MTIEGGAPDTDQHIFVPEDKNKGLISRVLDALIKALGEKIEALKNAFQNKPPDHRSWN